MGSGSISFIFIIVVVGIMISGFLCSLVTLVYNSIDDHKFDPISFWLSIAFLIFLTFSIFALVDNVKYNNKHVLKTPPETTLGYKEIKTFDIYIKNGETYLNAKNAKRFRDLRQKLLTFESDIDKLLKSLLTVTLT